MGTRCSILTLVVLTCLCGCVRKLDPAEELSLTGETTSDAKTAPSEKVEALRILAQRLEEIVEVFEQTPDRPDYGVNVAPHFEADAADPLGVRSVSFVVNVFWCDDGCIDGPADGPATDDDLRLLLPFADDIEELDLSSTRITDAGLETVSKLKNLKTLNCSGTAIQGDGLAFLATLDQLTHIDLRSTDVQPRHLRFLADLKSLRTFHAPEKTVTGEVLSAIGGLAQLEELDLSGEPVTDAGLRHLRDLGRLRVLCLNHTAVTDAGLKRLFGLASLERLELRGTQITDRGIAGLAFLVNVRSLDLGDTQVTDAGLVHLAGMIPLEFLGLEGTAVRGRGMNSFGGCSKLWSAKLPPVAADAIEAINTVKSWRRLELTISADPHDNASLATETITFSDAHDLEQLILRIEAPLERIVIENCPALSTLRIERTRDDLPSVVLQIRDLPGLRELRLDDAVREIHAEAALENVARLRISGVSTSNVVLAISRCVNLESLQAVVEATADGPVSLDDAPPLAKLQAADFKIASPDAAWVLRLLGRATSLRNLILRGRRLDTRDLAPLAACAQLEQLSLYGVDDPGEPLGFLNHMPNLDQCLLIACPRIGKVRLTGDAGVRRFYFKYGRLDELEIDGAANLTAVYLGNKCFGENDEDVRAPPLDIRRIVVDNAPELLYLCVNAERSNLPVEEFRLGAIPSLRSLTLHAPEGAAEKCLVVASGVYQQLAACRLLNLAVDSASIERLTASEIQYERTMRGLGTR